MEFPNYKNEIVGAPPPQRQSRTPSSGYDGDEESLQSLSSSLEEFARPSRSLKPTLALLLKEEAMYSQIEDMIRKDPAQLTSSLVWGYLEWIHETQPLHQEPIPTETISLLFRKLENFPCGGNIFWEILDCELFPDIVTEQHVRLLLPNCMKALHSHGKFDNLLHILNRAIHNSFDDYGLEFATIETLCQALAPYVRTLSLDCDEYLPYIAQHTSLEPLRALLQGPNMECLAISNGLCPSRYLPWVLETNSLKELYLLETRDDFMQEDFSNDVIQQLNMFEACINNMPEGSNFSIERYVFEANLTPFDNRVFQPYLSLAFKCPTLKHLSLQVSDSILTARRMGQLLHVTKTLEVLTLHNEYEPWDADRMLHFTFAGMAANPCLKRVEFWNGSLGDDQQAVRFLKTMHTLLRSNSSIENVDYDHYAFDSTDENRADMRHDVTSYNGWSPRGRRSDLYVMHPLTLDIEAHLAWNRNKPPSNKLTPSKSDIIASIKAIGRDNQCLSDFKSWDFNIICFDPPLHLPANFGKKRHLMKNMIKRSAKYLILRHHVNAWMNVHTPPRN